MRGALRLPLWFAVGALWHGANTPGRMGGVLGLARVVDHAADNRLDWERVVQFGTASSRGRVSLRRLAAVLEVLGHEVPERWR